MPAVTRTVRGARRTGRGFGCAHPKCRCGFYPCADRRSASLLLLGAKNLGMAWARLGRKKRRESALALSAPAPLPRRREDEGARRLRCRGDNEKTPAMTDDLRRATRALISVSDKSGIVAFAR